MSDLDAYHRCLANRHRRVLLYKLRDRELTTVEELASTLAAEFYGPPGGRGRGRDEAATELHHHHLPKLDELSVVDYDARSGMVRVRELPPELEALLAVTERFDRRA